MALLPALAMAFDFDSYRDESMTDLLERAREVAATHAHDGGVEIIFPLTKLHLYEELAEPPYACDSNHLITYLGVMGVGTDRDLPPINTCIKIRAETGELVELFAQDQVARYIPEEVPIGEKMHLYAIWVYVNNDDSLPYLLLNEFKAN